MRPKAEALGYLEAKATTKATAEAGPPPAAKDDNFKQRRMTTSIVELTGEG
jgi:hypothetical protein